MSWSISESGKPLVVASSIAATASGMSDGQSKDELVAAAASITGLALAYPDLEVNVLANGHGSVDAQGKIIYSYVNITVTHKKAE